MGLLVLRVAGVLTMGMCVLFVGSSRASSSLFPPPRSLADTVKLMVSRLSMLSFSRSVPVVGITDEALTMLKGIMGAW